MTWMHQGKVTEDLPEGCIGFVYLITNKISGRKYVGQKLALSAKPQFRTVLLKTGAKKTIRIPGEHTDDWRSYFGSNQELLKDIELLGSGEFNREILHFCKSRSECSYLEAKEQFARSVLESDDYYNRLISCKVHEAQYRGNKKPAC